jgi:hypothetical protein
LKETEKEADSKQELTLFFMNLQKIQVEIMAREKTEDLLEVFICLL